MNTRARACRVLLVTAAALLLLLATSGIAAAAAQESRLGGKVRAGRTVTVPAGETVQGNLYVAGGTVRIDGTVGGDLVASGGDVEVAGTVTGDVLVVGGQVSIDGTVRGDVRVSAGRLTVDGSVGGDLVFGVGAGDLGSRSTVGGDVLFAGGRVSATGNIEGNVLGIAGSYSRGGNVAGSENVTVRQPRATPTVAERGLDLGRYYLSVLLAGLLFLWLAPAVARNTERRVRGETLASLLTGFVSEFALVVGLLIVLVVGALLAVALGLLGFRSLTLTLVFSIVTVWSAVATLLYAVGALVAPALVGVAIGNLILTRSSKPVAGRPFGALALGALIVVVLLTVPILGWIVGLVVPALGLGALAVGVWRRRGGPDASTPSTEAVAPADA